MRTTTLFLVAAAMAITSSKAQGEEFCVNIEPGKLCAKQKPAACQKSKAILAEEKTRCEKGLDGKVANDEDPANVDLDTDNGTWDADNCSCAFEASEHEFCDLPVPPAPKADGVREVHGAYQCSWAVTKASQAGNAKRTGGLEDAVFGAKNAEGKREGGIVIDLAVLKKTVGENAAKLKEHGGRLTDAESEIKGHEVKIDHALYEIDGTSECAKMRAGTANEAEIKDCLKHPGLVILHADTRRRVGQLESEVEALKHTGVAFAVGIVGTGFNMPELSAKLGESTRTIRDGTGFGLGVVVTAGYDFTAVYTGLRLQSVFAWEQGSNSANEEETFAGMNNTIGVEVGTHFAPEHLLTVGVAFAHSAPDFGRRGNGMGGEGAIGYRYLFGESGIAFDARGSVGFQNASALVVVHRSGDRDQVSTAQNDGAALNLTLGIVKVF